MSIKRKLTLIIMGISLAAVMLTVGSITAYLIYDMRQEKIHEMSVIAEITGDRNRAGLMFMDNVRVVSNLEIFQQNPAILVACIYDKQNALFAGYTGDGASNIVCPENASLITPLEGFLTATKPINYNDEVIGQTYLVSNMSVINAYVQKILIICGTVTVLVLGTTLMLAVYFQRTISGPLLELATTAEMVTASGNYNFTANESYSDETGILARSFNTMLEEVRRRDRELVHANENLEEKVKIRTRELEEAMLRAEAANEAKSEFLRNMSHEFRTPLHAIISFSSYGIKEYGTASGEELKRYFEIIRQASDRLCNMVNEVLDLARMENGTPGFTMESANLKQMVTFAVDMIHPLAKDKNLALHVEHVDSNIILTCDQGKIVQVITNILGNAVKFTPKGANIKLRTQVTIVDGAEHISLSVADEGVGIPEGETEMIFESFRQSSRTNTGAGGTGLGLAICSGIIRSHGGRIWAENNQDGSGSTFTFILPLKNHYKNTSKIIGVNHENAA